MKKVSIIVSMFSMVHFLVECARISSYSKYPVYVKVENSQDLLPVSRVYLERDNIVVIQYKNGANPLDWDTFMVHLFKYPTIDTLLFKKSPESRKNRKYSTFLLRSPISVNNGKIIINILQPDYFS